MNQLSKEIVNACNGHPSSLKVMVSYLNGQKRISRELNLKKGFEIFH